MPSTGTRLQFIEDIALYVKKYGTSYGIKVNSPVIAQAVIESRYGESGLAKYHNYFGLKVGSGKSWTGDYVTMKTKEEYVQGVLTEITDRFRAYPSRDAGVNGYYVFTNTKRYSNLKGVTSPLEYVTNISNDGYATSSKYITTIMNAISNENLTRFDDNQSTPQPVPVGNYSPDVLLNIAGGFLGYSEADGRYKEIIDIYNSQSPLPQGYKVKYTDAWCATFVTACAVKAGYTSIIPPECSCERMIKLFMNINCWQEDESVTPKPGWIIFYDWQDNGVGDNTGHADHVGIVLSVTGGTIRVIEGNYQDAVGVRTIAVNGRYIRGYGVPKYTCESGSSTVTPTHIPVTPKPVQQTFNKTTKYQAKITAHKLNIRSWAGKNYSQVSFSPLSENTVVDVCDTTKASDGSDWCYIKYNGKYGFCSAKYLQKIETQTVDSKYTGVFEVRVNTLLNMRSTPDTSSKDNIIAKLSNKTRVNGNGQMVTSGGENWIRVTYKNYQGYCCAKYLMKI